MPSGGWIQVNQFDKGFGHVNISVFRADGSLIGIYGKHYIGEKRGGWYDETARFDGDRRQGHLYHQSDRIWVDGSHFDNLMRYLQVQTSLGPGTEKFFSPVLMCVGGVEQALQTSGIDLNAVDLMKADITAVYVYAAMLKSSIMASSHAGAYFYHMDFNPLESNLDVLIPGWEPVKPLRKGWPIVEDPLPIDSAPDPQRGIVAITNVTDPDWNGWFLFVGGAGSVTPSDLDLEFQTPDEDSSLEFDGDTFIDFSFMNAGIQADLTSRESLTEVGSQLLSSAVSGRLRL